ncbi:WD40-repeat-containing domain protein, partial [Suillus americanus]
IRIWDSSSWMQVGEPWRGHGDCVYMIALNSTGTLLASASGDLQVRVWRVSDQRTIAIFKHTDAAAFVTFSKDGKHILSGGIDKMISNMMEAEQTPIRITTATRTFQGHGGSVFAAAVFPDGRRMVTASYDKTLRLWDLEDSVVLKIMKGHRFGVRRLALSRNGEFIASGDGGGELIAWNRDGESLTQPIKVHSKDIWSLDFSPDSRFLA